MRSRNARLCHRLASFIDDIDDNCRTRSSGRDPKDRVTVREQLRTLDCPFPAVFVANARRTVSHLPRLTLNTTTAIARRLQKSVAELPHCRPARSCGGEDCSHVRTADCRRKSPKRQSLRRQPCAPAGRTRPVTSRLPIVWKNLVRGRQDRRSVSLLRENSLIPFYFKSSVTPLDSLALFELR